MSAYAESITVEDLEDDPYPVYARLRAEAPVAWVPAVGLWLVTRAPDVEFVTTHPNCSPLTSTARRWTDPSAGRRS